MTASRLELADVFRLHGSTFLETHGPSLSSNQKKVIQDITVCRTAALGAHVQQCDQCGHQTIAFNSCRNRHCPKCQAAARAEWLQQQESELLPVPSYFHVVFTLPQPIAPLALQNQRLVYGLLFRAASETLLQIAADPKHLGAAIGFMAVLHTWGQNLHHHPHLHCVVPGGGLAPDRSRWVAGRKQFFLPVKVLSRVFRGKFVAYLRKAFQQGKLSFHGKLQPLAEAKAFFAWLKQLSHIEWVVYAKPPFGGPHQVLKYLARYTHRVALSNQRLVSLQNHCVTFRWKDYAHANQERLMTLEAHEFIRRFLLHVLPSGFVRIRHFGILANRGRKANLALCQKLLAASPAPERPAPPGTSEAADSPDVPAWERCPACQTGRLVWREVLPPPRRDRTKACLGLPILAWDTS